MLLGDTRQGYGADLEPWAVITHTGHMDRNTQMKGLHTEQSYFNLPWFCRICGRRGSIENSCSLGYVVGKDAPNYH